MPKTVLTNEHQTGNSHISVTSYWTGMAGNIMQRKVWSLPHKY